MQGREAMAERYGKLFDENPDLHVEITNRMALGNHVIDREHGSRGPDGPVFDAVAIYRVENGLIRKVWFVPK